MEHKKRNHYKTKFKSNRDQTSSKHADRDDSNKGYADKDDRNKGYADKDYADRDDRKKSYTDRGYADKDDRDNGYVDKGYSSGEQQEYAQERDDILIGRNPVLEALKSGREIEKLLVVKDQEGSIRQIIAAAKDKKIPINFTDRTFISRICNGKNHQGVLAYTAPYKYCEIEDIIAHADEKKEDLFVVILDGIEDPHNLGAIIRSAEGAGAHGIVILKRRAVGVTETAVKASAGAVEYMPVARVSNLVQAIDKLKESGAWIYAVDMDGETYSNANLKGKIALVIGNEGAGISRLVKEHCDVTVSLPMKGKISSLNASNAAAILMYEVNRQRGSMDE